MSQIVITIEVHQRRRAVERVCLLVAVAFTVLLFQALPFQDADDIATKVQER